MLLKRSILFTSLSLALSLALVACGSGDDESSGGTNGGANGGDGDGAKASWLLESDPGEAVSVLEARDLTSGDSVRVVGRVSNLVPGRAAFRLMDGGLEYCGETNTEDGCKTPWDYCCEMPATKAASVVFVEARDEEGQTAKVDSTGLRLLDLVVVDGTLETDEQGNAAIVANGWYRRERPELRDGLNWPEE